MTFWLTDKVFQAAPILNIAVPQSGHLAFIAGLPFFMVTFSGLGTSFLARHLTQYIVAIFFTPFHSFKNYLINLAKYKKISSAIRKNESKKLNFKSLKK